MIDKCMRKAAEWCVAFRNRTDGDGDIAAADDARDALKEAIRAAIATEREACAVLCERLANGLEPTETHGEGLAGFDCANAIRMRSNA